MNKKTKGKIIELSILAIVLLLVLSVKAFDYYASSNERKPALHDADAVEVATTEQVEPEVEKVVVHVSGAVVSPDVYEISKESRVKDAIDKAGGFTDEADQSAINLAGKVYDTQKIVVYKIGEVPAVYAQNPIGSWTLQDLNEADAEKLMEIKGIGESMAARILDYRNEHGPFNSIDDLLGVSGIGEKKLASIKEAFESSIKK